MAGLIVVLNGNGGRADDLPFDEAVRTFAALKGLASPQTVGKGWCRGAKFPRRREVRARGVYVDPSGGWLILLGHASFRGRSPEETPALCFHEYEQHGEAALEDLDGFYVAAVWSSSENRLSVVTDRAGSAHAYRTRIGDSILISSSSLALAALQRFNLDQIGCLELLTAGTIYGERTLYEEITKLAPATIYGFDRNGVGSARPYWSFQKVAASHPHPSDWVQAYTTAVADTLRALVPPSRRPVCDLTGGYDSRFLAAALKAANIDFAATVTARPGGQEAQISRRLADCLGVPHRLVQLPHKATEELWRLIIEANAFTEGETDIIEYARVLSVHERLAAEFDLSINGAGGEMARQFPLIRDFPFFGRSRRLDVRKHARAYYYLADPFDKSVFGSNLGFDLTDHYEGMMLKALEGLDGLSKIKKIDYLYLHLRLHRWQGRLASSTNHLWPSVSPFLYRRPLEIAVALPACWKQRSRLFTRGMLFLNPAAARIPMVYGHPCIPLTLASAHLFVPALVVTAKKAARRFTNRLTYGDARPKDVTRRNHFPELWNHPDFAACLDPQSMETGSLYDEARLRNFLQASRREEFIFSRQLARIFTLERTVRLARGRLGVRAQASR